MVEKMSLLVLMILYLVENVLYDVENITPRARVENHILSISRRKEFNNRKSQIGSALKADLLLMTSIPQ